MNKYLSIAAGVLLAVSAGWAQDDAEEVAEEAAVEQVEENAEDPAAPAVESQDEDSASEEVAATEEVAADAAETEEVASAEETSEETVEAEEDSDDEEDTPKKKKKSKKKKKKSKKKKSKKKKHYDDDEDFEPMRFGFHAGLASNVSVISTRGNATLDLGLGFAYFFTPNIGVVTGADLGIGYAQYKIPGYLYAYGYYESNVRSVVFSVDVPVKVRYAINSDFWVEAGTGLYVSVYGYTHSSNDFNSQDTYSSTISAGVRNYTIGGGMNLGSIGLGAEVGYVSGGWSLGVNLYTGL